MNEIVRGDSEIQRRQDGWDWIRYECEEEIEAQRAARERMVTKTTHIPGYPECYQHTSVEEQIAVLREFWPELNPGSRIKELESRPILSGSEGVWAIPKWESIAGSYGDALDTWIFPALATLSDSGFYYGSRFDALGSDYLRRNEHVQEVFAKMNAQQDGDILIIQAQFGAHHRTRASLSSRRACMPKEFGLTTFAVACMLLTHPNRLVAHNNLWADCPGDEYHHAHNKKFSHTPAFSFYAGKIFFSTYPHDIDFTDCGLVTGFQIE